MGLTAKTVVRGCGDVNLYDVRKIVSNGRKCNALLATYDGGGRFTGFVPVVRAELGRDV